MKTYLAGTDVHLEALFIDRDGNSLPIVGDIQYRILAGDGAVLLPWADVQLNAIEPHKVSVTVPASVNQLSAQDEESIIAFGVRELRAVEVMATLADGNKTAIIVSYAIEPIEVLVFGVNSFCSLRQAQLIALDIPNTSGWSNATQSEQIAAMIEAKERISRLQFVVTNRGQEYLVESASIPDITLLTPTQLGALPLRLLTALSKAQVAEANSILGIDPIDEKRRSGLVSEKIGESSESYRQSKAIELPVSKEAMRYLGAFVSLSKVITRT